jgi:hypothetical protein
MIMVTILVGVVMLARQARAVAQCDYVLVVLSEFEVLSYGGGGGKNNKYELHWLHLAMVVCTHHSLVEGIALRLLRLLFKLKIHDPLLRGWIDDTVRASHGL